MAKPVKGNKNKRPASDERRLKSAHLNNLKRNVAIISSRESTPDGFKVTSVSKEKIRIKGPGAQAIKLATHKNREDVIQAVAQRNWTRVVTLIPMETAAPIDYKNTQEQEVTTKKVK
jgi:hypothetical protein